MFYRNFNDGFIISRSDFVGIYDSVEIAEIATLITRVSYGNSLIFSNEENAYNVHFSVISRKREKKNIKGERC